MGNRDDAVVRALASQQCGLGSIPAPCHMWVEFVRFSLFSEGFSPGSSVFLTPKTQQMPEDLRENQLSRAADVASSPYIVIYLEFLADTVFNTCFSVCLPTAFEVCPYIR